MIYLHPGNKLLTPWQQTIFKVSSLIQDDKNKKKRANKKQALLSNYKKAYKGKKLYLGIYKGSFFTGILTQGGNFHL